MLLLRPLSYSRYASACSDQNRLLSSISPIGSDRSPGSLGASGPPKAVYNTHGNPAEGPAITVTVRVGRIGRLTTREAQLLPGRTM